MVKRYFPRHQYYRRARALLNLQHSNCQTKSRIQPSNKKRHRKLRIYVNMTSYQYELESMTGLKLIFDVTDASEILKYIVKTRVNSRKQDGGAPLLLKVARWLLAAPQVAGNQTRHRFRAMNRTVYPSIRHR